MCDFKIEIKKHYLFIPFDNWPNEMLAQVLYGFCHDVCSWLEIPLDGIWTQCVDEFIILHSFWKLQSNVFYGILKLTKIYPRTHTHIHIHAFTAHYRHIIYGKCELNYSSFLRWIQHVFVSVWHTNLQLQIVQYVDFCGALVKIPRRLIKVPYTSFFLSLFFSFHSFLFRV